MNSQSMPPHRSGRHLRVAIDVTAAVCQTAGIGRYVRCLVQALTALDHQLNLTFFWTAAPGSPAPQWIKLLPTVHLRRIPISERWATIVWQRARLPIPVEAVVGPQDICHFPDFVLPPVAQARTVLTIHDLSFRIYPETADSGLRRYLESTVPRSARAADLILADSEATRADVINLLGEPASKVHTLLSGVDSQFRPQTASVIEELRHRYQLTRPFILSVGTLQPRKNYARLIEAFSHLPDDLRHGLDLAIAGRPGWLYQDLNEQIRRWGVDGQVRFLTNVGDLDLPALYSAATIFVSLSLYEGFGLPSLEAMACGTPVVVSRVSSLPEVVGSAGILVDPLDVPAITESLQHILTDGQLREQLAAAGVLRAQEFTWERSAHNLLAHYRRLVARR
ncbi:MAG: glycosyltransferase family 4 protein [Chloroflexi bacterium]|nr:glycosyltransferase family 4 protein [Chloroflexota bacterium]